MSDFQDPIHHSSVGTPRWVGLAVGILGGISLVSLGLGWSAINSAKSAEQATQSTIKQANDTLNQRLAKSDEINQQLQSDLKVVTDKLKITQGQLKKARAEAVAANQDTTQKLTALDTGLRTELATKAATDDLKNVDTKVVGVRTDLDTTREDLKMARSEMGTLIARNHDEIDQLRRLGERDYIEFTIAGKNKPQKVGNLTVELKGVNEKRGQFSVAMTAEDRRLEKKNRSMNEPIFFYLSGTKIPEELVVNKVGKDTVSGYVSVPKANSQPQASASSSGK